MQDTYLNKVKQYIADQYGGVAERPWGRAPAYTVFRHKDNSRMYGIITTVPRSRLDGNDDKPVDIITLKVGDALLRDVLTAQKGIFPGLGFGERSWITVLLDGTVPIDDIFVFVDHSFSVTATAKMKKTVSGEIQYQ